MIEIKKDAEWDAIDGQVDRVFSLEQSSLIKDGKIISFSNEPYASVILDCEGKSEQSPL